MKNKLYLILIFVFIFNNSLSILAQEESSEEWKEAEYYSKLGFQQMTEANYEEAIESFSRIIELIPDADIAYSNRGVAKLRLNDFEGCLEDSEKAIELMPNNGVWYLNRSYCLYYLKDLEGAINDAQLARDMLKNTKDRQNFIRAKKWYNTLKGAKALLN